MSEMEIGSFVATAAATAALALAAWFMTAALHALEKNLPGFSFAQFQRKFAEGDVEDSIEVYRRDGT